MPENIETPTSSPKSPLTKSKSVYPSLGTPTYPANDLFTILTSITIAAAPSSLLEVSLDTSSWPKWNTFVPRADILSQPSPTPSTSTHLDVGTTATFHSKLKETGPTNASYSNHRIVSTDKISGEGKEGWCIVWRTIGIPGGDWIMRTERVQEIVETKMEDGTVGTGYRTWGTFGGPMAYMLSWTGVRDDIVKRFEDWGNNLKACVEKLEEFR